MVYKLSTGFNAAYRITVLADTLSIPYNLPRRYRSLIWLSSYADAIQLPMYPQH